jgi:hypothetical protein
MVTVARIDGIQIVLHFNDHGRPHFHAVTADDRVTIDIETLQLMKGSMPRARYRLVKKWAQSRQALLLEAWKACRSREIPEQIP